MIKNEKQYQITKKILKEFNQTLIEVVNNEETDPIYKKIEEDAIKSQISVFENEIEEYELLRKGEVSFICADSWPKLYEVLIKARICKGWNQADLAKQLDLKEQQIQRYELCNYSTASVARVNQIASVLGIAMNPIKVKLEQNVPFQKLGSFNQETISNAYQKMKEKRCLLTL